MMNHGSLPISFLDFIIIGSLFHSKNFVKVLPFWFFQLQFCLLQQLSERFRLSKSTFYSKNKDHFHYRKVNLNFDKGISWVKNYLITCIPYFLCLISKDFHNLWQPPHTVHFPCNILLDEEVAWHSLDPTQWLYHNRRYTRLSFFVLQQRLLCWSRAWH